MGRSSRLLASIIGGIALGAGISAVSPAPFLTGWLAASLLLIPALFALIAAWHWATVSRRSTDTSRGGGRLLAWMVALAFVLRLLAGVGLSLALPVWGYAEPEQQAGYLFKDAYFRDTQAWNLAQSGSPIWASFREEFSSDQYGGLLAISALVYRFLSPDAHRPFLILILGAFTSALGLPFLDRAIRRRWPARVALIAGWIYVVYPDALFFGGSQMREPFLVGLGAIAFWSVITWQWRDRSTWIALAASLAGMAIISNRVAAALAGFLALLFLLEYVVGRQERRWQVLGWIALGVGFALVLLFSWTWFRSSSAWDMVLTLRNSGWINKIIEEIGGDRWRIPVVIVYGLAQPVLPAAIAETTESVLWKIIIIARATGWYALAPFLVYGVFSAWKEPERSRRLRAVWLAVAVLLWLVIAAARGGGDQTDNPRYRSLFLPWLALLAAWAIDWALAHRDAWLWRWIAVEAIFLGFFSNWYFSRYWHLSGRLPFWQMVVWILVFSGGVLLGGLLWDRFRRSPRQEKSLK
jgi:hypothetical protein